MKLADAMATHNPSPDLEEVYHPTDSIAQLATSHDEPEALIVDEFDPTLSFRDAKERAVARWERWYVEQLLQYTRGNLSEAARIAHSDRGHLRKLARKHLQWESPPSRPGHPD